VTPEGNLYVTGGFQHLLKVFLNNTFIMDDHRSTLVPLKRMHSERADHGIIYNRGLIYVFGGQAKVQGVPQSLAACEVYSIKDDAWTELPPMSQPRQALGVCLFNDKYIFAFGGKNVTGQSPEYTFASQVEVFDIDRNAWKVINYISEQDKLRLVYPGSFQVNSKRIIIFGGLRARRETETKPVVAKDGSQEVIISNETLYFDVASGEVTRGPDLQRSSYYFGGCNVFPQGGVVHAFGFSTVKEVPHYLSALTESVPAPVGEINHNQNKKTYHCFKVAEESWQEVSEAVFTGQRKMSIDTLDETL